MNLKIIISTLLFMQMCIGSSAQFCNVKAIEIEKLKQVGMVTVAISDDEESNNQATEVMTEYWKVTKFKIIKKSELEEYVKSNPENYILTYLNDNYAHTIFTNYTSYGHKTVTNPNGLTKTRDVTIADGLILAKNVKKIKRLKPSDGIIYSFIDNYLDGSDSKAEFMREIGQMNAILSYPNLKDDQIGGWKLPTIDQKAVTSKELWICRGDMTDINDEAKLNAAYAPYKYKMVSGTEIIKAIMDKRNDIVYAAKAEYQVGAYMFIIHSPVDNSALFFMGGTQGFGRKEFEKIKKNKVYGN